MVMREVAEVMAMSFIVIQAMVDINEASSNHRWIGFSPMNHQVHIHRIDRKEESFFLQLAHHC